MIIDGPVFKQNDGEMELVDAINSIKRVGYNGHLTSGSSSSSSIGAAKLFAKPALRFA